jgi:leucyl aminopeptidase
MRRKTKVNVNFQLEAKKLANINTDCLVVGVFADKQLTPSSQYIDQVSQGQISAIVQHGDLTSKLGQSQLLYQLPGLQAKRVLLVNCGEQRTLSAKQFINLVTAVVNQLKSLAVSQAVLCFTELAVEQQDILWQIRHMVLASAASLYCFDQFKSQKHPANHSKLQQLAFYCQSSNESFNSALSQGMAMAKGVKLTKDLANLPGNICTPSYLAEQAQQLAQQYPDLQVEILTEQQMAQLGMNTLLSVSAGSQEPARFIIVRYQGAKDPNQAPQVLVGKGITFDSGGLSIKLGANMYDMKYDMAGAASVLGTMLAAAQYRPEINLIGLIASAENMPSGHATRPRDIVTSLSGKTVEIINTDAEGRLVLCDALTYAERFNPAAVIDVATLTGAIILALGRNTSGLMGNNKALINALQAAGTAAADPVWPLPLNEEETKEHFSHSLADLPNIPNSQAGAGSINAGYFLSRFAEKFPWAHLDIAGTAWRGGSKQPEMATGRPVALLAHYLFNLV